MSDQTPSRSAPDGGEMAEVRHRVAVLLDGLETALVDRKEDQRTRKVRFQRLIQKCKDVFEKYMNPSHQPFQARPDELDQPIKDASLTMSDTIPSRSAPDGGEMAEIRHRVAVLLDGLETALVDRKEDQRTRKVRLQRLIQKCEDVFEKYMNPSHQSAQAESAELNPSIQDGVRILLEHAERLESTDIEINSLHEKGTHTSISLTISFPKMYIYIHIANNRQPRPSARSAPDGREMDEIRRRIAVLMDGLDTTFATHEEDETVRKTRLQDLTQKCKDVYKKNMNPSLEPVQARPDELDQPIKDAVRIPWEHAERLESTDIEKIRRRIDVLVDGLEAIFVNREEDEPVRKTMLQGYLIQECEDVYEKYVNPSHQPVQAGPAELDRSIQDAVRILWEHAKSLESTDIESLMTSLNEKDTLPTRSPPDGREMDEIRHRVAVLVDGLETISVDCKEDKRSRKVKLQRLIQKCEDVFEKYMNPSHQPVQGEPDELDPSQDAVRILWEHTERLESTDIESLINSLRDKSIQCREKCSFEDF
ncbi:hypothetical protein MMC07_007586 [Pseudocyphellaria aurata]|nr:hypothetical protein [Pseudocyphellaria aurata]